MNETRSALVVRDATQSDSTTLVEVAALTFPLACPPYATNEAIQEFLRTTLSEHHFEAFIADPHYSVLVAETAQAIIGYALLMHSDPADARIAQALHYRPTCEISKFYVLQERHHTEVAPTLMAAVRARAIERGAAGVWLGVNQLNTRAQRFYAKQGFTRVGTKHFLVGDQRHDDFVMEGQLVTTTDNAAQ